MKEKRQLGRHTLPFCRQPKKENLTIHLTLLAFGQQTDEVASYVFSSY
jgi:hypothetical protein